MGKILQWEGRQDLSELVHLIRDFLSSTFFLPPVPNTVITAHGHGSDTADVGGTQVRKWGSCIHIDRDWHTIHLALFSV